VLEDVRVDFVYSIEIGTEEDSQVIAGLGKPEARPIIVERVSPVGVPLLRDHEDR
jgi:hypothetical protein